MRGAEPYRNKKPNVFNSLGVTCNPTFEIIAIFLTKTQATNAIQRYNTVRYPFITFLDNA
jgi:hypothetical protein